MPLEPYRPTPGWKDRNEPSGRAGPGGDPAYPPGAPPDPNSPEERAKRNRSLETAGFDTQDITGKTDIDFSAAREDAARSAGYRSQQRGAMDLQRTAAQGGAPSQAGIEAGVAQGASLKGALGAAAGGGPGLAAAAANRAAIGQGAEQSGQIAGAGAMGRAGEIATERAGFGRTAGQIASGDTRQMGLEADQSLRFAANRAREQAARDRQALFGIEKRLGDQQTGYADEFRQQRAELGMQQLVDFKNESARQRALRVFSAGIEGGAGATGTILRAERAERERGGGSDERSKIPGSLAGAADARAAFDAPKDDEFSWKGAGTAAIEDLSRPATTDSWGREVSRPPAAMGKYLLGLVTSGVDTKTAMDFVSSPPKDKEAAELRRKADDMEKRMAAGLKGRLAVQDTLDRDEEERKGGVRVVEMPKPPWDRQGALRPEEARKVQRAIGDDDPTGAKYMASVKEPTSDDWDAFAEHSKGGIYTYKRPDTPGADRGVQVGPRSAQEMAEDPIGRTIVRKGPGGKLVLSVPHLAKVGAAQGSANTRRIAELEKEIEAMGARMKANLARPVAVQPALDRIRYGSIPRVEARGTPLWLQEQAFEDWGELVSSPPEGKRPARFDPSTPLAARATPAEIAAFEKAGREADLRREAARAFADPNPSETLASAIKAEEGRVADEAVAQAREDLFTGGPGMLSPVVQALPKEQLESARAHMHGVDESMFLGAGKALGGIDPEKAKAREEEHPIAHKAGQAAGLAGALLFGKGKAQQAKAAVKAAETA
jgi:hypothetical protein